MAEIAQKTHEAFAAETFTRLREIKPRYDPRNLFHLNLNITPTRT